MNRNVFHVVVTVSLSALALSAAPAAAALIQLDAVDTGSYRSTGFHDSANENYLTGQSTQTGLHRSFFVFDLTGVSAPITAATMNLFNPNPHPCCRGYVSQDATETFSLFDVSTSAATLTGGGADLTSVFLDLGTGDLFGTRVASAADNGTTISIAFNAAGLAALNGALGATIAFGGALTTLSGPGDQYLFGFTLTDFAGGDVRRLDLTTADVPEVPEPASLTLLAFGLAGMGARRWGRKSRRLRRAASGGQPCDAKPVMRSL